MHNTSENNFPFMDSTDWASRFVPLPPTEFPFEATNRNHKEGIAISGGCVPGAPMTPADLPCLQAIAGIDPFFTPADPSSQTLSSGPVSTGMESSPLLPSTEPSSSHPNSTPVSVVNDNNLDHASGDGLHSPSVEVIGQQTEQTLLTTENDLAAETPLCEEKTESNLMKNPNQEQPIVEIHEYDLAMKVLSKTDASFAADGEYSAAEVVTNETGNSESPTRNDAASYWSQNNVSSFVPGVTPIEAYPVCQEYEEHLSLASDARYAAESGVVPEQENPSEQVDQQGVLAENVSDRSCEIAPESVDATAEPLQVDPFENDEFESVCEVALTKPGNQNLQTASVSRTPTTAAEKVEPAQEDQHADSSTFDVAESAIHETASMVTVGTDVETPAEPMAEEASATPEESQSEPTAEVPEPSSTPLDVTQEIPQWPNRSVVNAPMSSHQLFDSVEQSLSDLQSINQLKPEGDFSPVNEPIDSSDQPQADTATPIESPEVVAVEQIAETQQSVVPEQSVFIEPPAITEASADESPAAAQEADLVAAALASLAPPTQRAASKFEPVDLTAQLPVSTDAFSVPPTVSDTPSLPTEVAEQSPVGFALATDPVEMQTPVETPVLPSDPVPAQHNTPSFEPVDLTAQLPVSTDAFSTPPTVPDTPSLPTEAEQSPVEFVHATAPVEMHAAAETPVLPSDPAPAQQNAPSFEPAGLTAQLPVSTDAFSTPPTVSDTPSLPAEAEQSPVEFVPATASVEMQTPAEAPVPPAEPASVETPVAPEPKGQVIEVDGDDGYDFLDLKAFDVANAIFTPGIIFLDDGKNRFQIEYRNLKHAVFAGDFQVELN